MKKVMNVWAKISSLILVVGALIYLISVIIKNINNPSNLIGFIFLVIIMFIGVVIISTPIFYFAWVKNNKDRVLNKIFKVYAKIVTIILPIIILYDIFTNNYNNIYYHLLIIIINLPSYYFGWKD